MEIKRKIASELEKWKNRPGRQPLLVLGARQVGKSFSVTRFGQTSFAKTAIVNFQTDLARLRPVFEKTMDPHAIVEDLGYLIGATITPGETLLVFDEVQLCPPALTSLKYFAEQAPEYDLIATGSLFGVAVNREDHYTFPVGKVDVLHMAPLDFEEFLWACGKDLLAEGIRTNVRRRTGFSAHDEAISAVRQYMMSGGLPRVVSTFAETGDWGEVRRIQRDVALLYAADMALYAQPHEAVRIRSIWNSVPSQLTRVTNRKFILSDMKSGARFHQYETGFAWLDAAGLVHRHFQVEEPVAPLRPRNDGTFFKAYLFDVGILSAQLDVTPRVFCSQAGYAQVSSSFRGGIAENYVKQALVAAGLDSSYWSSGNTAEVDFLLVDATMKVVPMEVKSSDNTRSRSLESYRTRFHPEMSIRLSTQNIGGDTGLTSLPLYAAFCLPQVLGIAE